MVPKELIELLLIAALYSPLIYFFYLYVIADWSYIYTQKQLHGFVGNEYWEFQEGELMAWNEEDGRIYIHK